MRKAFARLLKRDGKVLDQSVEKVKRALRLALDVLDGDNIFKMREEVEKMKKGGEEDVLLRVSMMKSISELG